MEFSLEFHPFEVLRRFSAFVKTFEDDFSWRFPEFRKRRVLELQMKMPTSVSEESLFERFQVNSHQVSILDWQHLAELNEDWKRASLSIDVAKSLEQQDSSVISNEIRRIEERLHNLSPKEVSLRAFLWSRWIKAPLIEEAKYLCELAQH